MRVGVAGLGLIGGSIALGLAPKHDVVGYDTDGRTRDLAAPRGLRVATRLEELLPADAVVVATPLTAIGPTLDALAARSGEAVLIEVGSVKADVAAYAQTARARIVGLHPMAGSTTTGFAAADPALLRERPFLVVPYARSDERAMRIVGDLARDLGGVVTVCSVAVHDRAVAMLSGVPLAVAIALARAGGDVARFAGPGFRDATRLAATPEPLARAVLAGNRERVREALASFRAALDEVERSLE